jgi:hypothetical protein
MCSARCAVELALIGEDRLQGGDHTVGREDQRPEQRSGEGLVVAHPPPHEVAAPDLAQPRQHEQPADDQQPLHLGTSRSLDLLYGSVGDALGFVG